MDFHDALCGSRTVEFRITDRLKFCAAVAAMQEPGLEPTWGSAVAWWKRSGELLPGTEVVEVKQEEERR